VEERYSVIRQWANLDKKLQSELISRFMQTACADVIPVARRGNGDHEADIYINNIPVELKTTHQSNEWRGGEYSKRAGDFLLVSWKDVAGTLAWFSVQTQLEKSDWKSATSPNYYGTTISLDHVLAKEHHILVGGTYKARIKTHPVYASISRGHESEMLPVSSAVPALHGTGQ
jgi:hypothetical protein